jgi:hypothetical protein
MLNRKERWPVGKRGRVLAAAAAVAASLLTAGCSVSFAYGCPTQAGA